VGWGATFPVIDASLAHASPLTLNAVRFAFAALLLLPRLLRPAAGSLSSALGPGLALGVVLAAAYALQTYAMPLVGPSRSAFLTAFYVIFTPLLDWIFNGERPSAGLALGALLAFGGAALMSGDASSAFGLGDLLTLGCALLFAGHITLLSWGLRRADGGRLLFLQIAACALVSALLAPLVEAPRFVPVFSLVLGVLFLSVVATVLLIGFQTYGQSHTSASRAALLFASEPIWAALLSALLGERLAQGEILGAGLILAGILVALNPMQRRARR
jgi:drug/metabolite transporter (DMT)-like permease